MSRWPARLRHSLPHALLVFIDSIAPGWILSPLLFSAAHRFTRRQTDDAAEHTPIRIFFILDLRRSAALAA